MSRFVANEKRCFGSVYSYVVKKVKNFSPNIELLDDIRELEVLLNVV